MRKLTETTFGNVVLGGLIVMGEAQGQKIDEPKAGGGNENGQNMNMAWSEPPADKQKQANLDPDDIVMTNRFSLKDKPELRTI